LEAERSEPLPYSSWLLSASDCDPPLRDGSDQRAVVEAVLNDDRIARTIERRIERSRSRAYNLPPVIAMPA
jgi:hypothetical protein